MKKLTSNKFNRSELTKLIDSIDNEVFAIEQNNDEDIENLFDDGQQELSEAETNKIYSDFDKILNAL